MRLSARPHRRISEYLAHRRRREQQVLELLVGSPQTVQDLAAAIYPDLDPRLRRAAEGTVVAHLEKLVDEGRIHRILHAEGTPARILYARTNLPTATL